MGLRFGCGGGSPVPAVSVGSKRELIRSPRVLLRHVQRLVPGKRRDGLDGGCRPGTCQRVRCARCTDAVPAQPRTAFGEFCSLGSITTISMRSMGWMGSL